MTPFSIIMFILGGIGLIALIGVWWAEKKRKKGATKAGWWLNNYWLLFKSMLRNQKLEDIQAATNSNFQFFVSLWLGGEILKRKEVKEKGGLFFLIFFIFLN